MEIFDRLRQFDILSHFSNPQIQQLASCTSRVKYDAGQQVLTEGEDTLDAYLVDQGHVEIRRSTPYGLYTLAKLNPGELFGEASFIDRHARSGDALAVGDTVLMPFNPIALGKISDQDPKFQLALYWTFWKSLSHKLRQTNERLAQFFQMANEPAEDLPKDVPAGSDVHVGIHDKRELFREHKLSPMEINFLATLSKAERIESGEVLFREGQEGDRMYVVLEGRVMISKQIAGAGEEALAFLERGDFFGEMALIDRQPRSADATADKDGAVVLTITREVLEGMLDIQKVSSIRLLMLLSKLVAKRLREVDDKLVGWFIFSAGSGNSLGMPG